MDVLNLIGRNRKLFSDDMAEHEEELKEIISQSSFLILGGAGSIGQAVTKEIFKRSPRNLDVIDISENNLVELVRDLRSSLGYIKGDFHTYALDIGSWQFDKFLELNKHYDYILNLSALKHVRSEKDPFTLLRMIEVNVLNTIKTIEKAQSLGVKKYFCVSTDKAANPVNMMGASKRIMEMFLMKESENISISTARFANVAFSDGSLLHGFNKRMEKLQPIAAPNDIKRYFVTSQESGELCLMSAIFGKNRDIFFPKLNPKENLIALSQIAIKFLNTKGFNPVECTSEKEARERMRFVNTDKLWPCFFSISDTTGEKSFEEFYTEGEHIDLNMYKDLGIIKNGLKSSKRLGFFLEELEAIKVGKELHKKRLIELFNQMIPNFKHIEKELYLDSKM